MKVEEVTIPMPWGHVAGQAVGDPKDQFVLLVHGRQDNSASFQRLLKHLANSFYYVSIDLPCHGKSSKFPGNMPIHTADFIFVLKIILDYFDRKKYIIVAHSYGGQIALHFTQIYPEYVTKLILLDVVNFLPLRRGQYRKMMRRSHEKYLKIAQFPLSSEKQSVYTHDEALEKIIKGRRYGVLKPESAELILTRNIERLSDGNYRFTIDPRLNAFVDPVFNVTLLEQLFTDYPLECPTLFLLTPGAVEYFKELMPFTKRNKMCNVTRVDGDHNVHINEPEKVAPLVNQFLLKIFSRL